MADNVVVSANVGIGATVATDDIGGVQHQRIKLTIGADGVSEGDVSSSNPMPVNVPKEVFSQAVPVISSSHRYIHDGEVFRYHDSVTLGSGSSQDYLFTTPDSFPYAHLIFQMDGTAVTSFYLYEATDKTGTTLQTIFNANRNSANSSVMTLHKGISGGTTDGTMLVNYSAGTSSGGGGGGSSKTPAAFNYDAEWILKRNTKYIFRATSGTAGNLCNIVLEWYEHASGT